MKLNIIFLSCECPVGFEGPHCQQLRHSFSGNGWAWYESLEQCAYDTLSFEFATTQRNAILLYNGPMGNVADGTQPDFISVELRDGYPNVRISLGDGEIPGNGLYVTGKNNAGEQKMQRLSDGNWHMIEIIKDGTVRVLLCFSIFHCSQKSPHTINIGRIMGLCVFYLILICYLNV